MAQHSWESSIAWKLLQLSDKEKVILQLLNDCAEQIRTGSENDSASKNMTLLGIALSSCDGISADLAGKIIMDLIMPLLDTELTLQNASGCLQCLTAVVSHCDVKIQADVIQHCLGITEKHAEELTHSYGVSHLDKTISLEVLLNVLIIIVSQLSIPYDLLDKLIQKLNIIVRSSEEAIAGKVVGSLFPVILNKLDRQQQQMQLENFWNLVVEIYQENITSDKVCTSERPYLILCGLADFYFPVGGLPNLSRKLECQSKFWKILQNGLYHTGSLCRKRAMYLLKRILDIIGTSGETVSCEGCYGDSIPVFCWDAGNKQQLSIMWQDLIMLLETLEEKQVHVIKPLLPRFLSLIKASYIPEQGKPWLHTSWVTCVCRRVAGHESLYLKRWGLMTLLNIDLCLCPIVSQGGLEFLSGPFMDMITDASMYHRQTDTLVDQCPPIAKQMTKFFLALFGVLTRDQAVQFSEDMFARLAAEHWNSAALLFILRSLCALPVMPLWGAKVLQSIRDLLVSSITCMDTMLRGAVQCFLLIAFTRLINLQTVTIEEVAAALSHFKRTESLHRGNSTWKALTEWLKSVVTEDGPWSKDMLNKYLQSTVFNMLKQNQEDEQTRPVLAVSRMLLLAVDAGVLPWQHDSGRSLDCVVSQVSQVLQSVNSHAYMSTAKADQALRLLTTLAAEVQPTKLSSQPDHCHHIIMTHLQACSDELVKYIERQLQENIFQVSDSDRIELFVNAVRLTSNVCKGKDISPAMNCLIGVCQRILQSTEKVTICPQMKRVGAMKILSVICTEYATRLQVEQLQLLHSFFAKWEPEMILKKPDDLVNGESKEKQGSESTWGKMSEAYMAAQWACLNVYLSQCILDKQRCVQYMDAALDTLDLVAGHAGSQVLLALLHLLPQVCEEGYEKIVSMCWAKVREEGKTLYFWSIFKTFVKLALNHQSLSFPAESQNNILFSQVVEQIFVLGEEKQGLVHVLTEQLCEVALSPATDTTQHKVIAPILVRAVKHGPIYGKGKRFLLDVKAYLCMSESHLGVHELIDGMLHTDRLVQVQVLTLFASLRGDNPLHVQFARALASNLIEDLRESINLKTCRYYSNTQIHREKHRCIVALGLLVSLIEHDQEFVEEFYSLLMNILLAENQPSLRAYAELYMIRLALNHTPLLHHIVKEFDDTHERRSACFCSLMIVTIHLAKLINDTKTQEWFIEEMIKKLFPLCMVHPINLRTFGQAGLLQLYQTARVNDLSHIISAYSIIDSFQLFYSNNQHACRTTVNLMGNFMMQLHAVEDWSMETLTQDLPRLTLITDEEWIQSQLFEKLDPRWAHSAPCFSIPLRNQRQVLSTCQPGTWRLKLVGGGEDEEAAEGDVQKKIQPWRGMLPEEDPQQDYISKRPSSGKLVLVTSLIDKTPNLGGLCRTSEIFGVSEFVIGKMKYIQDKNFESLSVTAHKWVPIVEVRPHELKDYLLMMKRDGYTLVGAEQTANSKNLIDYTFPVKTLLLLGNEKEGIPVELLQLLDVCVEIPQAGVIRSLNVHVCGALLIWQYARQHLFANS